MKYEHLNFIIQNNENSATTTYFQPVPVTYQVYIGSKARQTDDENRW